MTNNVEITSYESWDGIVTEWVTIDHGNGQFTSMSKAVYDKEITTP